MKRVTIKDIAKIAGVSYATVSRALSDSPEISVATRTRIKEICAREGYRVNTLARSLINNRTDTLGLILPNVSDGVYSEMAYRVETYARAQGYTVMLCNSQNDPAQMAAQVELLAGRQVDGLILCTESGDLCEQITNQFRAVPTVLLGEPTAQPETLCCNVIRPDSFAGGRMGIEYLAELGHTEICYLGGGDQNLTLQLRLTGAQEAAERLGVRLTVLDNPTGTSSVEVGRELAAAFFAQPHTATALFAATDALALGALEAAEAAGIRIPDDLSLLGFDNCPFSDLSRIRLTTVDPCKPQLGEQAVELLLERIRRNSEEETNDYIRSLIPPVLVARGTCQPRIN